MFNKTNGLIFISHSKKDLDIIDQLTAFMQNVMTKEAKYFCTSRTQEGVPKGENFSEAIYSNYINSYHAVYLITQNFLKSVYCMQELGFSFILPRKKKIYLIFPDVTLDDLKGFVNSGVYQFAFVDTEDDMLDFAKQLNKKVDTKKFNNAIRTFNSSIKTIVKEYVIKSKTEVNIIDSQREQIALLETQISENVKMSTRDKNIVIKDTIETVLRKITLYTKNAQELRGYFRDEYLLSLAEYYIETTNRLKTNDDVEMKYDNNMNVLIANIYLAISMKEEAYKYFLIYLKQVDYVFLYPIRTLIEELEVDLNIILNIVEEKYKKLKVGSGKEWTKETLDFIKTKIKV